MFCVYIYTYMYITNICGSIHPSYILPIHPSFLKHYSKENSKAEKLEPQGFEEFIQLSYCLFSSKDDYC